MERYKKFIRGDKNIKDLRYYSYLRRKQFIVDPLRRSEMRYRIATKIKELKKIYRI